jgi:hypothetical protein
MDTSDAITTQAQEDTSPPSPKNDASSVDDENEASSYKAMIERWGGDILNERGPFSNVDMKVVQ